MHNSISSAPWAPVAAPSPFAALGLIAPLVAALSAKGYTEPSPIQAQAVPPLLTGRDLLGCAQTGTGKTAAFALPILQRLHAAPKPRTPFAPRVLVLTPTRELAAQIGQSFSDYGQHLKLRHAVIFGGVGQHPQVKALRAGCDILVATPGRLLDLHQQGYLKLGQLEVFVLDEADRMLDMGFIHDVRRIIALLPAKRQTLFFSATLPDPILELSRVLLTDPVKVEVTPQATTAERVDQKVCFVERTQKLPLLVHLLNQHLDQLTLVFIRTKHGANKLATQLERHGLPTAAIHGNKSQNARTRALEDFRAGKLRVLVATDIAARGLDIKGVGLVVNFDLPDEPESYVHRIGRTARAGADGVAIALCDVEDRTALHQIQRLIRQQLEPMTEHEWHSASTQQAVESRHYHPTTSSRPASNQGRSSQQRGGGRSRSPRAGGRQFARR
ncbi:MAG: DEAD/DEAH box helicase [Verrucomicrobia bacterium]|nr:DEAD/DEAH box helicase [Verrucomicrobiota bacterium]